MDFVYTFPFSNTSDGTCDPARLNADIIANGLPIDYVSTDVAINVYMTVALTSGQQTTLANIIAAHRGTQIATPNPTFVLHRVVANSTVTVPDGNTYPFFQRLEIQAGAVLTLSGDSRLVGIG